MHEKAGKAPAKKPKAKAPSSASSTESTSGVTTTMVRNPDETWTVTKTDRDGNILSREGMR